MSVSPLLLTAKDDEIVGASGRQDAMGVLAIWSERGRNLVPHLTEQTTRVRGFQVLVEAFRLWDVYEPAHPEHADRLEDFFLLIEQAFARTVGCLDGDWDLPGARRVRARSSKVPQISVEEPSWHLLDGQKANGLWGLYRGAANRAGLLADDMRHLSDETSIEARLNAGVAGRAQERLLKAVQEAMDGATVELPWHMNNALTKALYNTYWDVPLADHLHARLIEGDDLNKHLAKRLLDVEELDHRSILAGVARDLPEHRAAIMNAIRCEDLLAVVEAVFLWLCSGRGKTVEAVVRAMPVDLEALGAARGAFEDSGDYRSEISKERHRRFCEVLDHSSKVRLVRSVLSLHKMVSEERQRAPWVWEEQSALAGDAAVECPSKREMEVGVAWRNDYYLSPLHNIAHQLAEVREWAS